MKLYDEESICRREIARRSDESEHREWMRVYGGPQNPWTATVVSLHEAAKNYTGPMTFAGLEAVGFKVLRQRCDDCGEGASVVELGQEPDYESSTAKVCEKCLRKALGMLGAECECC